MSLSRSVIAVLLSLMAWVPLARTAETDWIRTLERFPLQSGQDAAQAARLAELSIGLAKGDPALLAEVLDRATILAVEDLTRSEFETANEARRLRAAAVNAAMANAQVANLSVDADDVERFQVTLTGPGYWRLEGELPPGLIGWRSSCAAQAHGVADPSRLEIQLMLWRTRLVDDRRRTITLHQGGSLMEALVLTVPPNCTEGAELVLQWINLPPEPVDASGQPVHRDERELALRQMCEQLSAESEADPSACLTQHATYHWLFGHESGRHDQVLVGLPVLLSQFNFTTLEPVPALHGINIAFLNGFPGCDDLIVSELIRYLNGLDGMAKLGLALSCNDDGMSEDGMKMPIQMQRREAAASSTSP